MKQILTEHKIRQIEINPVTLKTTDEHVFLLKSFEITNLDKSNFIIHNGIINLNTNNLTYNIISQSNLRYNIFEIYTSESSNSFYLQFYINSVKYNFKTSSFSFRNTNLFDISNQIYDISIANGTFKQLDDINFIITPTSTDVNVRYLLI